MTTITVWLLLATSMQGVTTNIAQFPNHDECEAARAQAVEKISHFYKSESACVKATIVRAAQ